MANLTREEKRFRQFKNLPQHKDKTDEEIRALAIKSVQEQPKLPKVTELLGKDINIAAKFKSQMEKRMAVELLERYLQDYEITSVSDKNTLQEVIYLEVLQLRLQDKLNELHSGDIKALPYDIISIVHKNSEVIIKLKSTLGLNKAKQEKLESFTELDLLKKRFIKWREENQASRTIKCPYCVKFIFLKMRTEHWESQQHPFFRDNMIYNKHLFAHYGQTVLIDDVFISNVLETSRDYIEWVLARVRPTTITKELPNGNKNQGEETSSQSQKESLTEQGGQDAEQPSKSSGEATTDTSASEPTAQAN